MNGGIYAITYNWWAGNYVQGWYSYDGITFESKGSISEKKCIGSGTSLQYVGSMEIATTSDGILHLVYFSEDLEVRYSSRSLLGVWSSEIVLSIGEDVHLNVTCPRLS